MSQFSELCGHLEAVASDLPNKDLPEAVGQLEKLKGLLWARLSMGSGDAESTEDRLLDAGEASERLGISKDSLYRKPFPFTVRLGRSLRFSSAGIEQFIRSRKGR